MDRRERLETGTEVDVFSTIRTPDSTTERVVLFFFVFTRT